MEFGYKLHMLGWRGYFLGPDCRSKRSCRCGDFETHLAADGFVWSFFPIGNWSLCDVIYIYIEKLIGVRFLIFETRGCFAKRLFVHSIKIFGTQKIQMVADQVEWFWLLVPVAVAGWCGFGLLSVDRFAMELLAGLGFNYQGKIRETKRLRNMCRFRIRKDKSWVKQFQGCKSW